MGTELVKKTNGGAVGKQKAMVLTIETIMKYINPLATEQEAVMFLELCRVHQLNPFIREAYLIKYGNQPASLVVGKETFTKRAERNKEFNGFDAGIVLMNDEGTMEYRKGSLQVKDETLVGGWAEVHRKDKDLPFRCEVSFDEYAAKKKDGALTMNWREKPATMIRKVALVQALREAFPNELGGMFTEEELESSQHSQPDIIDAEVVGEEAQERTEAIKPGVMLLDLIGWDENEVFSKVDKAVANKLANFLVDGDGNGIGVMSKDMGMDELVAASGKTAKQIETWHKRGKEFASENNIDLEGK